MIKKVFYQKNESVLFINPWIECYRGPGCPSGNADYLKGYYIGVFEAIWR